jgi:cellulose synthase/poly-beta-1,6-N-acetylglucosamine synthase-like glycosyltransferase
LGVKKRRLRRFQGLFKAFFTVILVGYRVQTPNTAFQFLKTDLTPFIFNESNVKTQFINHAPKGPGVFG